MLDTLLTTVVFPISKKIGDRWIDRVCIGVDDTLKDLIHDASVNGQKSAKIIEYIGGDKITENLLKENIKKVLEDDSFIRALTITLLPNNGEKLNYYKSLLQYIFNTCFALKRDVVLKGFLNGVLSLSLFKIDGVNPSYSIEKIGSSYLNIGYGAEIYLKRFDDIRTLENTYNVLNNRIRMSSSKKLDISICSKLEKVAKIYENWVEYVSMSRIEYLGHFRNVDFAKLPSNVQNEVEISDTVPVTTMLENLKEIVAGERGGSETIRLIFRDVFK